VLHIFTFFDYEDEDDDEDDLSKSEIRNPKSEMEGSITMDNTNSKIRLLVIDDEENMRHMLSKVLGKAGYQVDSASDGSEGLQMISER
jgi:PleD family two-component response regulator